MRNMIPENSPCPETQNKMVSSSKGEIMVCGLDHSGFQPFRWKKKDKSEGWKGEGGRGGGAGGGREGEGEAGGGREGERDHTQLSASNIGILNVPAIITDGTPGTIDENFDAAIHEVSICCVRSVITIDQSDGQIVKVVSCCEGGIEGGREREGEEGGGREGEREEGGGRVGGREKETHIYS